MNKILADACKNPRIHRIVTQSANNVIGKSAKGCFELDKSKILRLVLIGVIIVLTASALAISRDYQDSWILEGLEIPFALFVAVYALTFFSEKSISWMVALAVIGRFVFLLIPNLKYVWFQGTSIDQHQQYALADYVVSKGYIEASGPGPVLIYGNTPFIHLALAMFSIVLGVPVVDSLKYLPVFLSPLYPLLTYGIIKNLKFPNVKTILKYALFVSSIPFIPEKYIVTGAQFGVLLSFLILASLVMFLGKEGRTRLFIWVFIILVLPVAHSSSSVLLASLLVAVLLLQRISYFRLRPYLQTTGVFLVILTCAIWLMFPAKFTFENIIRMFVGAPTGTVQSSGVIPFRFFELARVDILGAIKTILVLQGTNILLLLLTLGGLVVMLKLWRQLDNAAKFLFLLGGLMLALIPAGFLLNVGALRAVQFASSFLPIFSGILLSYFSKKRIWTLAVIFLSIILLATLQLYRCQPLIPSANALSKDLPASEPITYVTEVNSIYQRQMIEFTMDYVNGQIVCDQVTKNQLAGLAGFDFSDAHLVEYYPLGKKELQKKYDFFLIHLPGVSGLLDEPAEIRTEYLVLSVIYNSSIIYSNGESFILAHTPIRP